MLSQCDVGEKLHLVEVDFEAATTAAAQKVQMKFLTWMEKRRKFYVLFASDQSFLYSVVIMSGR